jgi:exosortase
MSDPSTNITIVPMTGTNRPWAWFASATQGWSLAVAALTTCWLCFFNELRGEWDTNAQYNYGYVVPLLGAMLFWRRWPERPAASLPTSSLPSILGFGLLCLLLPLTLVREANPEWRLLYWTHAFLVLGISLCLLYRAGGWTWVRFFAPPLLFILIAVPWPMEWEQTIIQNLMRFVAFLTVGVLGWLGVPSVQHGNLIEVAAGMVGINEACSGIRSLQSGLMLSLFLGEMYRFTAARRSILVIASLLCVLVANVARTTFLTFTAAHRGLEQMEAWHDAAGLLVMLMVLPTLFVLAHRIKPRTSASSMDPSSPRLSEQPTGAPPIPAQLPRWVAISVFAWLATSEVTTEFWYRSHEKNLLVSQRWSVNWPVQEARFKKTTVPEQSLAILRCSTSDSAAWKDEADNQWSAFFLRWNAGRNSAQLARGHRPDICFPAAGARLVDAYDDAINAAANGLNLPFKYQTFQAGDQLLHVFYCLWSDRVSPQANVPAPDNTWDQRFHAVWTGERNLGQQVFEIVIVGPENNDAAVALFKRELPRLIQREP